MTSNTLWDPSLLVVGDELFPDAFEDEDYALYNYNDVLTLL